MLSIENGLDLVVMNAELPDLEKYFSVAVIKLVSITQFCINTNNPMRGVLSALYSGGH